MQATLTFLERHGVEFTVTEHGRVFNMAEREDIELPFPDRLAKNLFIRDNKKKNYYLLIVKGSKRVNLKDFSIRFSTQPLSFAGEQDAHDILGLKKGHITPLGLLEESAKEVALYVDQELLEGNGLVGVHPNQNTATVWLKTKDLIALIRHQGNEVQVVEL